MQNAHEYKSIVDEIMLYMESANLRKSLKKLDKKSDLILIRKQPDIMVGFPQYMVGK